MSSTEARNSSLQFDLLDRVGKRLNQSGSLRKAAIGWHCHLTSMTVAAATVATEAGARLFISEANPATTMQSALHGLKSLGVSVYTGVNCTAKVLTHRPQLISDTGLVLFEEWLKTASGPAHLEAACEITASGVNRLKKIAASQAIPVPVVDLNATELKSAVENFHGVGDGLMEALQLGTGLKALTENAVVVVGYGRVGSGCAQYLKAMGARVAIIERDPIRSVKAHYDGFSLCSKKQALQSAEIIVTATGSAGWWQEGDFSQAHDGLVVVNVGHDREEVSPGLWETRASKTEKVNDVLTRYTFNSFGDKCLYLATEGNPANIALLTGSFEPTLIHLATELLTWDYLLQNAESLDSGELRLPRQVEEVVGSLTLEALGYNR